MAGKGMGKYNFITSGRANEDAVIKGESYRFTVLTSSLVRMEYTENGYFEDRATQSVINREFPVPAYTVQKEMIYDTEWIVVWSAVK